jgi:hypothetical protein
LTVKFDCEVTLDDTQTRSFQYIDDLVDGLVALMNLGEKRPVNLGNGDEFTILEFAHLVRNIAENVQRADGIASSHPTASISYMRVCRRMTRRNAGRIHLVLRPRSIGSRAGRCVWVLRRWYDITRPRWPGVASKVVLFSAHKTSSQHGSQLRTSEYWTDVVPIEMQFRLYKHGCIWLA